MINEYIYSIIKVIIPLSVKSNIINQGRNVCIILIQGFGKNIRMRKVKTIM